MILAQLQIVALTLWIGLIRLPMAPSRARIGDLPPALAMQRRWRAQAALTEKRVAAMLAAWDAYAAADHPLGAKADALKRTIRLEAISASEIANLAQVKGCPRYLTSELFIFSHLVRIWLDDDAPAVKRREAEIQLAGAAAMVRASWAPSSSTQED
jgi:hypothetical protein